MTKDKTVTMSLELAELTLRTLDDRCYGYDLNEEIRALLSAPVVERQEPIYQVQYRGDGGGGWSDAEKASYDAKVPHPEHWATRIVYASPRPPLRPELTDEQRDIEVTEMAEFMEHLSGGLRHFAGYLIDAGWRKQNACLDKVKEMNQ